MLFTGDFDGNDTVRGGSGNDQVFSFGTGSSNIDGGSGFDTLDYGLSATALVVDATAGTVTHGGTDTLDSIEAVSGSFGNDTFIGDGGDQTYSGNAGDDVFAAGAGNDTLTGGDGRDTFRWSVEELVDANGQSLGQNTITDFQIDDDRLELDGLADAVGDVDANLRLTETEAGSVLSASFDDGATFVDLVTFDGVSGLSLDDLEADGSFATVAG